MIAGSRLKEISKTIKHKQLTPLPGRGDSMDTSGIKEDNVNANGEGEQEIRLKYNVEKQLNNGIKKIIQSNNGSNIGKGSNVVAQ